MHLSDRGLRRLFSTLAGAAVLAVAGYSVLAQAPAQPARQPAARPAPRLTPREGDSRPIRVLLLGEEQAPAHASPALSPLLAAPLARRGIQLTHVLTPAEAASFASRPGSPKSSRRSRIM